MIRMPVKGISVLGRNTQGVRLVNLSPAGDKQLFADKVTAVTRMVNEEGEEAESDEFLGPLGDVDDATDIDSGDDAETVDDVEGDEDTDA
jgi:DNA gyrase subunit A